MWGETGAACGASRESANKAEPTRPPALLQLVFRAARGDGKAHRMQVSAAIAEQGERGAHIRGDGRDEIGKAALMRAVQVAEHLVADRAILFRKTVG